MWASSGAGADAERRRRRALALTTGSVAAVASGVAVAVLALVGEPLAMDSGLLDPGVVTRWGLPVAGGLRDTAATVTIGLLVVAVLGFPADSCVDGDRLTAPRLELVQLAAVAAAVWAAMGVVVLGLTMSEIAGLPVYDAQLLVQMPALAMELQPARLLTGSAVLAAAVAVGCRVTRTLPTAVLLGMCSLGALVPLAWSGHSASSENHELATNTLFAHLVGVTVWVGGLTGLVILRAGLRHDIAAVARRFSTVALWCFVLVAVSGVWAAVARMDGMDSLWSSYGAIVLTKSFLLGALGWAGHRHRRQTLVELDADPRRWRPFIALVMAELVIASISMGLGVALARTPLPSV